MPSIRILPDRVANQIAAGEVVERPQAVVKELVENALDAGATRVEVEFSHGGRSLMRVEDNGCGMSREDALLCLERHATSKIIEADDLNRLGSYGFRGEALPSIASVSRFTLQTRPQGSESGTEVLVNGGRLLHVRDCGRPVGTRIEVAQLFHPVPARRKFLKTDQTEAAHIVQCVRLYALACPGVSFTLIEDGRVLFRSPECPRLLDRVGEIFGRQFTTDLVPIEVREGDMVLRGLIGKPVAARPTRHEMISFINGRPVDSRTVNYAIVESYHEYIAKGRYPMAFLFLEIDPAAVDVNVHPAKREVRFRSEPQVRSFIIRAILQRLRELGQAASPLLGAQAEATGLAGAGSAVSPIHVSAAGGLPEAAVPSGQALGGQPIPTDTVAALDEGGRVIKVPAFSSGPSAGAVGQSSGPGFSPVSAKAFQPAPSSAQSGGGSPPAVQGAGAGVSPRQAAPVLTAWRFIGLAQGSLALFEAPGGLVVLDRRSALERIWYERLLAQHGTGALAVQRLLLPSTLELDPVASALVKDRLGFVQAHGFELVEFGRNFFRIEAVPDWMEPGDAVDFIRELAGALRDGRFQGRDERVWHEEYARLASAKAVRLSQRAGETEMLGLLRDLFLTRAPLTSPQGRATYFELSQGELARRLQI
jgi:DNA mismatch repair protein MutL